MFVKAGLDARIAIISQYLIFVCTDRYLGDQRFSYGLELAFTLRVGEEGARASVDDVIIEGDGRRISAPIFSQQNEVIQIWIFVIFRVFQIALRI